MDIALGSAMVVDSFTVEGGSLGWAGVCPQDGDEAAFYTSSERGVKSPSGWSPEKRKVAGGS